MGYRDKDQQWQAHLAELDAEQGAAMVASPTPFEEALEQEANDGSGETRYDFLRDIKNGVYSNQRRQA